MVLLFLFRRFVFVVILLGVIFFMNKVGGGKVLFFVIKSLKLLFLGWLRLILMVFCWKWWISKRYI